MIVAASGCVNLYVGIGIFFFLEFCVCCACMVFLNHLDDDGFDSMG